MSNKKVLIVSVGFFPNISPRAMRTTELAKEFARQGHEVVVYFPETGYDYSDFLQEYPIQIKSLGPLTYKAIQLNGKGPLLLVRRIFRRAIGLLFEYPGIELMFKVSRKLKKESGYDLLISIAVPYPIHWGVARVRSRRHKIATTWVADCGDPYMGETTDSFNKLFYFKYVEKWFSRKADFITIPIERARSAYYPEFQKKIRIIPQGFKLDGVKFPKYEKSTEYPQFAYAGGFIPGKRDPRKLMEFLLKYDGDFRFIVYTMHDSILMPYKDKLGDKLIIRKYIPREELLLILAGMDFLLNFDNNSPNQLPSKLIDYAITGRPVLNIARDTDLKLILDFFHEDYAGKMELSPPADYDITNIVRKFSQLEAAE